MLIGHIEALFRYPVKSMRGERLEAAALGWHGIDGDRRLALRRVDDRSGFPWLTATKVPELLMFGPEREEDAGAEDLPSHVRTPAGKLLPVFGDELAAEITRRFGSAVQMTHLKHGIFDDAAISVIATATVDGITGLAECESDVRRFRPNILVRLLQSGPFQEDAWLSGSLRFGETESAPAVSVTARDVRCAMVNFDPDTVEA
ncbi:MAG: MOSC domain-containing protein, partial [Candidatus Eremiobacteraeota bacterium]|nr:MOSC domain-containing protein [Candidatus Eremiobacteraeota bacterium]